MLIVPFVTGCASPERWTGVIPFVVPMRITSEGIIHRSEPGAPIATFPSVCVLHDGTLLATYRVGPTKESSGSITMLRRSVDEGRTWSDPWRPFDDTIDGVRGSLQVVYITTVRARCLLAAGCWVNREAYPGAPLFNPHTEGCLPMDIALAESDNNGLSWTPWRKIALPYDIGPASLTNPVLTLGDRLAVSIETNKHYHDAAPWQQRVIYVYSDDEGRSWTAPRTVCHDPTRTCFYWDQRAGLSPNGALASFSWTYHKHKNRYLNITRHVSNDQGVTWSQPEDLGFADQPSHPAVLPDGSAVLAWVDRYGTRSIRARLARQLTGVFEPESEVIIYESALPQAATADTGEMLAEMSTWSFGLPFAEALPSGDVLVVYYAGTPRAVDIRWARLEI
jgi:hypothetical protein